MNNYRLPNGADMELLINSNKVIDFNDIKSFYLKYNYDIDFNFSKEDKKLYISISLNNSGNVINNEISSIISDDEKNNSYPTSTDIINSLDMALLFDVNNVEEARLLIILAKYISGQSEVAVFDTYNGCLLTANDFDDILNNDDSSSMVGLFLDNDCVTKVDSDLLNSFYSTLVYPHVNLKFEVIARELASGFFPNNQLKKTIKKIDKLKDQWRTSSTDKFIWDFENPDYYPPIYGSRINIDNLYDCFTTETGDNIIEILKNVLVEALNSGKNVYIKAM